MQDKYTIGPVTIVQLVGLNAKPRIASAQADGAVRAADPSPPSAAAGLSGDLSQPVAEVAASYLDLRAAPALGLSADPVRGGMSFDSGVDRPVVDASASAPAADPSAFEQFLPQSGQPNPPINGRDKTTPSTPDNPAEADSKDATLPALTPSNPGESAGSFGDDEILDFAVKIEGADNPIMASGEFETGLAFSGFGDSDSFGIGEPDLVHGELVTPGSDAATSDAIPPI